MSLTTRLFEQGTANPAAPVLIRHGHLVETRALRAKKQEARADGLAIKTRDESKNSFRLCDDKRPETIERVTS